MSYVLSRPGTWQRSGLLGVVVGLHLLVGLAVLAARTIAPAILETPLVVDLLPAPESEKTPAAKPLPMSPPKPTKAQPIPAPRTSTPLAATSSTQAATEALPAAPAEAKPAAETAPAPAPVSAARFDADTLKNPAPAYPALSRRLGEEGKVVLRVQVTPQGTADEVEIRTSSGSQRLDEAARNTVRQWKFIPARRGDTPIQSWVLVPIIFKLEQ